MKAAARRRLRGELLFGENENVENVNAGRCVEERAWICRQRQTGPARKWQLQSQQQHRREEEWD